MTLYMLLSNPINYSQIQELINPWIYEIFSSNKYPLFNRSISLLLDQNNSENKRENKITLFLFFTLLPHFYKPLNKKEELFISLIKETPKLDLEKTNEQCLLLAHTCLC